MKISEAFNQAGGKPLLIAYICAGDPSPQATPDLVKRLVRAGADIVELGLPHSDPVADGPTIQAAAQRSIAAGMNTDVYFKTVAEIHRDADVPLVFMGYYNMVHARGLERFAEDCSRSGITGMIVPDLPPEEAKPLKKACQANGVDLIFLIAPNTPPTRVEAILKETSGFSYLVTRTGVTGAKRDISSETAKLISRVQGEVPRAVGFGISTPSQAVEVVRAGADAVIVGSAYVGLIARGEIHRLEELIQEMKDAILQIKSPITPVHQ